MRSSATQPATATQNAAGQPTAAAQPKTQTSNATQGSQPRGVVSTRGITQTRGAGTANSQLGAKGGVTSTQTPAASATAQSDVIAAQRLALTAANPQSPTAAVQPAAPVTSGMAAQAESRRSGTPSEPATP